MGKRSCSVDPLTVPRCQQGRVRAGTLAGSIMLFMALSGLCLFLTAALGARVSSQAGCGQDPGAPSQLSSRLALNSSVV